MDLEDCKRKGFIRKTSKNKELVMSLIEMSNLKEDVVKTSVIEGDKVSVFLPIAYDSLREILEGICIMHGFKVTSHVCVEKLLESIYKDVSFVEFDRFRYVRNSINYYGEKVDPNQGKEIIDKIFILKKSFLVMLNDLLK